MKARTVIASALALVFTASLFAADVKLKGVKCIMNAKRDAKADKAVAYKKGHVYFCCGGCPKAFSKAPKKHAVKANHQLFLTGQYVQSKCPLTGRPLNDKMVVKIGGAAVKVCCGGCKAKLSKLKGAKQAATAFNDKAFDKYFAPAKKDKKS